MATRTPERFSRQQVARRQAKAIDTLTEALAGDAELQIPPPVTHITKRPTGAMPTLSVEALELARQVYYLQHGSVMDAARAVIAAGLADTDIELRVMGRLRVWWLREGWPKRPTSRAFQIRDANHDGGLFRGDRLCKGVASGNGPAPKGKPCTHTALEGSEHCWHHDESPEGLARRALEGQRLAASKLWDMVPLEPFQRWCDEQRLQLLEEARAAGPVDPKDRGWGRLARAMGVDLSTLGRLMKGKTLKDSERRVDKIKAKTVARYIEPLGLTFRDIYGYDRPQKVVANYNECPNCGGYKNHESKTCRACHEAELGEQCTYVTRAGRRCPVRTKHPSGYCMKCRQGVERRKLPPKPRPGRPSAVTPRMLALALDEYGRMQSYEWIAERMWSVDLEGVCGAFKNRRSLAGSLVKRFRKFGVGDQAAAARLLEQLVAEHGPVEWPPTPAPEHVREVPFEPFRAWLQERWTEVGGYKALAARTGLNDCNLSQWIRRTGAHGAGKTTVARRTIDSALEHWGDGTTYGDLYA